MRINRAIIFALLLCVGASLAAAADYDPLAPTFETSAGIFVGGGHADYLVETKLGVPLLRLQPALFSYQYQETTPFRAFRGQSRADVLYQRHDFEADLRLNDSLRLIALAGYDRTDYVDQHGLVDAYAVGAGIGSVRHSTDDRWDWSALAGGYLSRRGTDAAWWTDARASWRVWEMGPRPYMQSEYRPAVALAASVESANGNDQFHGLYRAGPQLQLMTANHNRAMANLEWYHNDGDPFYGLRENGFVISLRVDSTYDTNYVVRARQDRENGWLPLVWGSYDVGADLEDRASRFQMQVELVDFQIKQQLFTAAIWYESRQDYRLAGDYDNIAYSVTAGVQSPIGLESVLSHGDPLIAGMDFLHRSDHSLNPDAIRVPPSGLITNGSHNLLPVLRLQTQGWDLPYRDPHMYDRRTQWVNTFDWRVAAGYDIGDTRPRGSIAGQLGLNWDAATVDGYVVYLEGLGSVGNETPDWLGELGVRRPAGKIFTRYERYGMEPPLGHGNQFEVGFGVFL